MATKICIDCNTPFVSRKKYLCNTCYTNKYIRNCSVCRTDYNMNTYSVGKKSRSEKDSTCGYCLDSGKKICACYHCGTDCAGLPPYTRVFCSTKCSMYYDSCENMKDVLVDDTVHTDYILKVVYSVTKERPVFNGCVHSRELDETLYYPIIKTKIPNITSKLLGENLVGRFIDDYAKEVPMGYYCCSDDIYTPIQIEIIHRP